jgi:squalene-hopene/tetraprenyl-beta-curcumene cyclase
MKTQIAPFAVLTAVVLAAPAWGAEPARAQTEMEKKAIGFLLTQQGQDGAWVPQVGPAITAMVAKGLIQAAAPTAKLPPDNPPLMKALAYIETTKQKDGGYYRDSNPNYNSAIVLSTFAAMSAYEMSGPAGWGDAKPYAQQIEGLQKFLKGLQLDETKKDSEGKEITKANSWYGGSGYGSGRPDLSNTTYFVAALHDSGLKGDDPALQKALVFVARCQMNGETNDLPFAKAATDGGFIYSPAGGGESKFGTIGRIEGGSTLRSYGSMTYSGFMSMLYAGLTEDDPRVQAAVKWIKGNWTLEYNPGSGASQDGQYYYLHAFARAMKAYNQDVVTDAKGVKHDWRAELNDFLKGVQKPDGSFVNEKSERWFEGNPVLATSYAVLALQEARK